MKTMVGLLVWSLLAHSLWAGDDDDVVVLKAEELSTYHRDLAKLLTGASNTTREAYVTGAIGGESPLPESEDRSHFLSVVHRSGYSWAESHDSIADFYIILEGSGTLLLGGEMVDTLSVDGRPGEWRAPRLEAAQRYTVSKGDLINIPSKVPHQWDLSEEEAVTYVIVKVLERAEEIRSP